MGAFARLLTAQNLELEIREIEPSASLTNSDEYNFDPLMVTRSKNPAHGELVEPCLMPVPLLDYCLVPSA